MEEPELGVLAIAETLNRPEPDEILRRARAGDLEAFEKLYRGRVGRVYALCLRMTSDPARAQDQTQETFVRAWRALGTYRGDTGLSAWLRRIAINVVLGDRRTQARRIQERSMDGPRSVEFPTHAPAPGSGIDLDRAISKLPARARDVFILHDVEGYRHDEIAALLDVTSGTSKSQLHRARKLLREALR